MDQLHPCPHCHRHIRAAEATCPFCATQVQAPARRRMPVGRLTRAAVFSWALVGAAGCSGDDEILVDAAFTGTDSSVVVADAAPSPDAETPDAGPAADAAPTDAEAADASTVPDAMVPLPYGAPPARGRLV